jgi:hypothetical protein
VDPKYHRLISYSLKQQSGLFLKLLIVLIPAHPIPHPLSEEEFGHLPKIRTHHSIYNEISELQMQRQHRNLSEHPQQFLLLKKQSPSKPTFTFSLNFTDSITGPQITTPSVSVGGSESPQSDSNDALSLQ